MVIKRTKCLGLQLKARKFFISTQDIESLLELYAKIGLKVICKNMLLFVLNCKK